MLTSIHINMKQFSLCCNYTVYIFCNNHYKVPVYTISEHFKCLL